MHIYPGSHPLTLTCSPTASNTHIHPYTHTYTYTYIHTQVHVPLRSHAPRRLQARTYIHTHTHIHTYIPRFTSPYAHMLPDGCKHALFRAVIPKIDGLHIHQEPDMHTNAQNDACVGIGGVDWRGPVVVHFPATGDEGYTMRSREYVCVCIYACVYVCIYVWTCVCVYVCVCMYVCSVVVHFPATGDEGYTVRSREYVCMYVCMYVCAYKLQTHTHTYIHTHTHTQWYASPLASRHGVASIIMVMAYIHTHSISRPSSFMYTYIHTHAYIHTHTYRVVRFPACLPPRCRINHHCHGIHIHTQFRVHHYSCTHTYTCMHTHTQSGMLPRLHPATASRLSSWSWPTTVNGARWLGVVKLLLVKLTCQLAGKMVLKKAWRRLRRFRRCVCMYVCSMRVYMHIHIQMYDIHMDIHMATFETFSQVCVCMCVCMYLVCAYICIYLYRFMINLSFRALKYAYTCINIHAYMHTHIHRYSRCPTVLSWRVLP
jgi:hypothetical protein